MGSPAQYHRSLVHLQNCMDAAEQAAIERWELEAARPLRCQLLEIARAAEAGARLDQALSLLRA
jgi:hypothetical protein